MYDYILLLASSPTARVVYILPNRVNDQSTIRPFDFFDSVGNWPLFRITPPCIVFSQRYDRDRVVYYNNNDNNNTFDILYIL